MGRRRLVLALSVFLRLGAGLLLLVGLARFLEPAGLGVVMLALAAGGMIGVVQDWGQPTYLLRVIGIRPQRAPFHAARALMLRGVMMGLTAAPVAAAVFWLGGAEYAVVTGMIIFAASLGGLADLVSSALRALRCFGRDLSITCVGSLFYVVLPVLAAANTDDLDAVAAAIVVAKGIHLIAAGMIASPQLRVRTWRWSWRRRLMMSLRASWPFAAESVLINGTNQADVFLLGTLLPLPDFGTYQAGARFSQAAAPLAAILMTSNLPEAARVSRGGAADRVIRRVFGEFFTAGLGLAALLVLVGPWISHHLYLERFSGLNQLWAGLAGAILLRFVAAAFNLLLTAQGRPGLPAWARCAYAIALGTASLTMVPQGGLGSVPLVLVLAADVLVLVSSLQYLAVTRSMMVTLSAAVPAMIIANAAVFLFS